MGLKTWREMELGAMVVEPGNSVDYKTGTWRSIRPIIDLEKCTHCMICWIYCPDTCIKINDSKVVGIDYDHCKGCGICAYECPVNAIAMIEESKAREAYDNKEAG